MPLHLARPFLPTRLRPPPRRRARAHYASPSADARAPCFRRPYTSVLVVPTGVGAGDALPVARALAAVADCVISHPNVLNAVMLYWPMLNTLYVEGYALDRFAEGSWALQPVHQNKVGLVLDSGIEEELRLRHLQVADAARASLGLPVVEYIVTDAPLEIGYTFLSCVLAGLSNAPQYVMRRQGTIDNGCIVASDVDSVILPKDACGGDGTLAFARIARKSKAHPSVLISDELSTHLDCPLIITVQENETVLDDTPDKFNIQALNVQNYWEAIGVIAAPRQASIQMLLEDKQ